MSDLRNKIIRLAHAKPNLRVDLLPLLKQASSAPKVQQIKDALVQAGKREQELIQAYGSLAELERRQGRPGVVLVYPTKEAMLYAGDQGKAARMIAVSSFLGFGHEFHRGKWAAIYWPAGAHTGVTLSLSSWFPSDCVKLIREKSQELQGLAAQAATLLEAALAKHDWYGAMSDDARYERSSRASMQRIKELLAMVEQPLGRRLWNKYAPVEMVRDPYSY